MTTERTGVLIDRARGGERAAFDELAGRFRERLRAVVHARLGAPLRRRIDPEDVVQESLLRAFRSLGSFEERGDESFFRWLAGIAINVIREAAKRGKRDAIIALDTDVPASGVSPSREGRRSERFERLRASLGSLRPEHRRVILLARVEKLPMKEVARRMDRSPEAASQLLWRALKKLKDAFGSTDSFHLPDRRIDEGSAP